MRPVSRADRELVADVVFLLGDLDGFVGVYPLHNDSVFHAAVVITHDLSRVRAAARLTVLAGVMGCMNIVSSLAVAHHERCVPTIDELAAARARDEARRAEWTKYRLDVDAHIEHQRAKSVLVVSSAAERIADVLRTASSAPLTTYGLTDVARVLEMLALYMLPNVVVLDYDLEETSQLEKQLRLFYPSRFGVFAGVQWVSTTRGINASDTERILAALGMAFRPRARGDGPLCGVRILVVESEGGTVMREVLEAASGAEVERVTGWEMIERLEADQYYDLVVLGDPTDVAIPRLVKFIARARLLSHMIIATNASQHAFVVAKQRVNTRYFVERPVRTKHLIDALANGDGDA
jgi:CheY-like chemotaxis protein